MKLVIAAVASVALAALITFLIIKATRESPPPVGRILVESSPAGAEITFDGERLAESTPTTIDSVPVGTRHDIRIELPRHRPFVETVNVPKAGGDVNVKAVLEMMTGKLRVVTQPDGAEIRIDGEVKGYAPRTIENIDMTTAKKLELRLKDYEPVTIDLVWPDNAEINIQQKLMLRP